MRQLLLGALCGAAALLGLDDTPPLRLYVEHAGQQIDVEIDKPFTIQVDGKPVQLAIGARATRVLELNELRLEYPKDATFELDDSSDSVTSWSIESPTALAMLQRWSIAGLDGKGAFSIFADTMQEQFPNSKMKRNAAKLKVAGKTIRGHRNRIEIGTTEIEQQYFLLLDKKRGPILLMLQDSLDDEGDTTPGFAELRELLEKTLEFK